MAEQQKTYEELERELAEAKAKLALQENKNGASSETLAIIKNEKARSKETRMLFIPEDLDPESTNTWQCQINGKDYLVPKGVQTEVPLAVYELYQEQAAAERKARENLRKAFEKANGK